MERDSKSELKRYRRPELKVFGDAKEITKASGNSTKSDCVCYCPSCATH